MDRQIDRTELLIDGLTLLQTDRKADRQTSINQSFILTRFVEELRTRSKRERV